MTDKPPQYDPVTALPEVQMPPQADQTGGHPSDGSGDRGAMSFAELYQDYASLIRAVIFRIQGRDQLDDRVQEAFVKIWQGLPNFGYRSSLKTWIYTIATRVAVDGLRRNKGLHYQPSGNFDPPTVEGQSPDLHRHHEDRQLVAQILAQLTPDQRVLTTLYFYQELTMVEIAQVLNIAVGTVKSRVHALRVEWRKALAQKEVTSYE